MLQPPKELPPFYRPDIDGLRAIAVLAVVGFHAEIAAFRGGFAGVDVFFVVSGYLISGIIFRSLRKDSFSFTQFYIHRINRIFPALGVVLLSTLAIGWFVLFPPEFAAVGKHVGGGAGFISNFLLWTETGYFDSQNKLLLHLWSLGVEEQFYIIWPLLLFVGWRKPSSVTPLIVSIGLLSFAANIWTVAEFDRSMAFYFPTTRLWELLAGALIARTEDTASRSNATAPFASLATSVGGVTLLIVTLLLINHGLPWPGWLALLPVVATLLLIGPAKYSWVNRRILSSGPLVWIGLISYPLYLWHWPLLVFGRLINEGQLPRVGRIAIVGLSIGLAWLTYEKVEKPIRFGSRRKRSALLLLPALAGIGLAGIVVLAGFPRPRLAASYAAVITEKERLVHSGYFNAQGTGIIAPTLRGDTTRVIAMLGDSHMVHYWPRFQELQRTVGRDRPEIILLAYGGCPPYPRMEIVGVSWDGKPWRCSLFHRLALAKARQTSTRVVVYSACWECYFDSGHLVLQGDRTRSAIRQGSPAFDSLFHYLEKEVSGLVRSGKAVYIIASNSNSPLNAPEAMLPRRLPGLEPKRFPRWVTPAAIDSAGGLVRHRLRVVATRSGAKFIDPIDFLCSPAGCPTSLPNGHAIYTDGHHFRPEYARTHASFVDAIVNEMEKF